LGFREKTGGLAGFGKPVKMSEEEDLEKVYIDLPNHWAVTGESFWAKPLGNDRYEIHNTPFYAYGINYLDIVEVDSSNEKQKPIVLRVIKTAGYQTLRIYFGENIDRDEQTTLFDEIRDLGVGFERLNDRYVALDIAPDGDYDAVCDKLNNWEKEKILSFETCEARNANNFDVSDK
jgi:hypothetical protein